MFSVSNNYQYNNYNTVKPIMATSNNVKARQQSFTSNPISAKTAFTSSSNQLRTSLSTKDEKLQYNEL